MTSSATWRQLRGFLAALLVFALAGAPGLDRLVCFDEGAAVAADIQAAALGHDGGHDVDHEAGSGHDEDGDCQHGHCHHGGVFMASTPAMAGVLQVRTQDPPLPPVISRLSDRQFGLLRPPRA